MRYKTYKEVDLPWLDKVPEHWEILSLRNILEERNEKNTNLQNSNILSVMKDIGVILYKDKGNVGNKASEDISRYKIVKPGDLVLNSMNVIIGSVGLSKYNGVLSPVYYVLTNLNESKYSMQYIEKIFMDRNFQQHLKVYGKGILDHRLRIPMGSLKAVGFPIPPKEEQEQIARFLDWKINEIDRLIVVSKNKIKYLLKIWEKTLNNYYNNGEYVPLKSIVKSNLYSLSGNEDIDTIDYIEISDVGYGRLKSNPETIEFKNAPSRARRLVSENDIIISTVRTYLKSIYKITEKEKHSVVSTGFSVLSPNSTIDSDYLYLKLSSQEFLDNVQMNSIGISYPAISDTKLLSLKIKIEKDINKQKEIAKFLNKYKSNIDRLIQLEEIKIEKLKLLKESLIADVVTGKIDVRNLVIPDYEEVKIEEIGKLEEEVSYGN